MESQSRNRRSVGALRSRGPFEGLGFGGGNGFFSDFFHRDPFDDPFFTQPFGSIFGSSDGFFGSFGGHQAGHFVDERPDAQQQGHRGPVIEELPDDHEENSNAFNSKSNEEPIVEHPDDDVKLHNPAYVRNRDIYSKHDNLSSSQPRNVCQSYSFSSVTYGGPGGTYYKSSTTRRAGANGKSMRSKIQLLARRQRDYHGGLERRGIL